MAQSSSFRAHTLESFPYNPECRSRRFVGNEWPAESGFLWEPRRLASRRPFFEIAWAAQRSGLYYTPISSRLTAPEVEYIVNDCGAKVFPTSAYKRDAGRSFRSLHGRVLAPWQASGGVVGSAMAPDSVQDAFADPARASCWLPEVVADVAMASCRLPEPFAGLATLPYKHPAPLLT